jgi:pimeloyl-ACP methyl ester carboxylesterase
MPQRAFSERSTIETGAGQIAYVDAGDGPVALFVHGVLLNAHLWRHAITELADERRCVAVDLPAHGSTRVEAGYDFSLSSQARTLAEVIDVLALGEVDLVGNDTGGAVCQILAASNPTLLRTLTLTNCDVQDQIPPATFVPVVEAAGAGLLAPALKQMYEDPAAGRVALGQGYRQPEYLTDNDVRAYLEHYGDIEGGRELERALAAISAEDLRRVEPDLRALETPTLIAWGTGDTFFDLRWAQWLSEAIPGAGPVQEIAGAKLFWPDEHAAELVALLRTHWADNAELTSQTR